MKNIIQTPYKAPGVLSLSSQYDQLFFGKSGHGISRYDTVRYDIFAKLNEKMQSFFWRPQEIDMSLDRADFDRLDQSEQHIFVSNLKRQILLDSIQGRSPSLVFLPHCTDPMLENCIITWGFFESIHSASYTHILRAIIPDPSVVFDDLVNIAPIAECASSISKAYDNCINNPSKKNLYLALISAAALEAIRFYVSFACTFSFQERALLSGSNKIVKLIAKDEIEHLALTSHILKTLPKDDPEFIDIIHDNREEAGFLLLETVNQEKEWAKYLFQEGSVLGLNEDILCKYIDHLYFKRAGALGLDSESILPVENPIPWINKHLTGANVQTANQEQEGSRYVAVSSIQNDASSTDFLDVWSS